MPENGARDARGGRARGERREHPLLCRMCRSLCVWLVILARLWHILARLWHIPARLWRECLRLLIVARLWRCVCGWVDGTR